MYILEEDTRQFMSMREIAECLGVDQRTARRWYDDGDFPQVYVFGKRKLLFKKEDVDIWIKSKLSK